MIVVGAKGFAKELLQVLVSPKYGLEESNLFFFDNLSFPIQNKLFNSFKVFHSEREVVDYFNIDDRFCLGLGGTLIRKKMVELFEQLGGKLVSVVSGQCLIGTYNTNIGKGTTILGGAVITNNVTIGNGCLIYMNTSLTHDVRIGDFVHISPGVTIGGRAKIGSYTMIGVGANILPDIVIGENCTIGAGAVITKDIPNNSVVVGNPGRIIKNKKDN